VGAWGQIRVAIKVDYGLLIGSVMRVMTTFGAGIEQQKECCLRLIIEKVFNGDWFRSLIVNGRVVWPLKHQEKSMEWRKLGTSYSQFLAL
jgi:hypothetical protein